MGKFTKVLLTIDNAHAVPQRYEMIQSYCNHGLTMLIELSRNCGSGYKSNQTVCAKHDANNTSKL